MEGKKTGVEQLRQMKEKKYTVNSEKEQRKKREFSNRRLIQSVSDNISQDIDSGTKKPIDIRSSIDKKDKKEKKNIKTNDSALKNSIDAKAKSSKISTDLNIKTNSKVNIESKQKKNGKSSKQKTINKSSIDNKQKSNSKYSTDDKVKINTKPHIDTRARIDAKAKIDAKARIDSKTISEEKNVYKVRKSSLVDEIEAKKNKVTDISDVEKIRATREKRNKERLREERREELARTIKRLDYVKLLKFFAVVLIIIGIGVAIFSTMIRDVEIEAGANYTKSQIEEMVIDGVLEHNAIYLFLKYRYSEQKKIPFVEYIDVSLESASKVKITVYDKNIIACTSFMNEYIFFDKDGIVLETSSKEQKGIYYVTGLNFNEAKLNSKIKVKDKKIFDTILNITQQIKKYKLIIKEINFDKEGNLTLYTDDIIILLGKKDTYDEQLAELTNLLKAAKKKNLKGILHMEKYSKDKKRIIFNKTN